MTNLLKCLPVQNIKNTVKFSICNIADYNAHLDHLTLTLLTHFFFVEILEMKFTQQYARFENNF